jgi:hypothetical protein
LKHLLGSPLSSGHCFLSLARRGMIVGTPPIWLDIYDIYVNSSIVEGKTLYIIILLGNFTHK